MIRASRSLQRGKFFRVAIWNHDIGFFSQEGEAYCASETACAAGDEYRLACKAQIHFVPLYRRLWSIGKPAAVKAVLFALAYCRLLAS